MGQSFNLDHLKKKGRALANRCFLCGKEEETVDHLLIHCPQTKVIWELLLAIVALPTNQSDLGTPFSYCCFKMGVPIVH